MNKQEKKWSSALFISNESWLSSDWPSSSHLASEEPLGKFRRTETII